MLLDGSASRRPDRDAVYEELSAARRIEAHRQAGEVLEAQHAGNLDPVLAELAHHFFQVAAREARS